MNREELKHVFYENLDLIQSRIDKSIEPLSQRVNRLEKKLNEIEDQLDNDSTEC